MVTLKVPPPSENVPPAEPGRPLQAAGRGKADSAFWIAFGFWPDW